MTTCLHTHILPIHPSTGQACHGNFGPVGDLVRWTKSPSTLGPAGPIFLWGKWSGPGTFGLAIALALAGRAGPNLP